MNNPRSILHIITRLDCGGSAENTLLTAIGFHKKGYRVSIVAGHSANPRSVNEQAALSAGIPIVRTGRLVRNISPISDLLAVLYLYRIIKKGSFDIVHTHTSKAGIVGRCAAILAGAQHVVHTPHGHIFYGYFTPSITGIFTFFERLLQQWTGALITLTKREKQDYLDRAIGPASKIYPVLSGIQLSQFLNPPRPREAMRRELGLNDTDFVAGTVARLVPIKNHDIIIEAAAELKQKLPQAHFVFVGDGELRQGLELKASMYGLHDRFTFTGWREDIPSLLASFDLFILCSHNEGMGRAFVEAQAAGIPVIGSNVGGIPEVLEVGITGYLVPPDDPRELASKINLLYEDRGNAVSRGEKCRAWAVSQFSHESMIDNIEKVYFQVLGATP